MLLYEYRCTKCQHTFELEQAIGAPAPACPRCGSPTRKVFSSVGLVFKGSGFHTTDYRKAAPPDDGAPSKTAPSKTAASSESGAKDAESPKDTKATKSSTDSTPSTGT